MSNDPYRRADLVEFDLCLSCNGDASSDVRADWPCPDCGGDGLEIPWCIRVVRGYHSYGREDSGLLRMPVTSPTRRRYSTEGT